MSSKFTFHRKKYGRELLVDLIELQALKKFVGGGHKHNLSYFDITVITGGQGSFQLDDKTYPIKKNMVLFSRPGQIRCWKTKALPQGYALIFEEEFLTDFFADVRFVDSLHCFDVDTDQSVTLTPDDHKFTTALLGNINREIIDADKDDHLLRSLLYTILAFLNKRHRQSHLAGKSPNNRHVEKFMSLVDQHFRQEHSVHFYADKICITNKHLNALSKAIQGVTAKQFIANRIMREARRLLLYSNASVTEIALALHFENTSHFIRAFRVATGYTPLRYRQQANP